MESFTNLEKKLLLDFLNELDVRFGNDGCNDFKLPNTEEGRKLFKDSTRHCFAKEDADSIIEDCPESGPIYTMNVNVLDYLVKKLERILK